MRFEGTSPCESVNELTFRFERYTTGRPGSRVEEKIEFWNFVSSSWELMNTGGTPESDGVIEITVSTNAGRFVQSGTGLMKARVNWRDIGVLFPQWASLTDQVVWFVEP